MSCLRGPLRLIEAAVLVICSALLFLTLSVISASPARAQTVVCNSGDAEIRYALAYAIDIPQVTGWFVLRPGGCLRESLPYYLVISQRDADGRPGTVDYGKTRPPYVYPTNLRFCVNPAASFTYNVLSGGSCPAGYENVRFSLHVVLTDEYYKFNIPSRRNAALAYFESHRQGPDNRQASEPAGGTAAAPRPAATRTPESNSWMIAGIVAALAIGGAITRRFWPGMRQGKRAAPIGRLAMRLLAFRYFASETYAVSALGVLAAAYLADSFVVLLVIALLVPAVLGFLIFKHKPEQAGYRNMTRYYFSGPAAYGAIFALSGMIVGGMDAGAYFMMFFTIFLLSFVLSALGGAAAFFLQRRRM